MMQNGDHANPVSLVPFLHHRDPNALSPFQDPEAFLDSHARGFALEAIIAGKLVGFLRRRGHRPRAVTRNMVLFDGLGVPRVEIDVVATTDDCVILFEVKHSLSLNHVREHANRVRIAADHFVDRHVMGCLVTLSYGENVLALARRMGVGLLWGQPVSQRNGSIQGIGLHAVFWPAAAVDGAGKPGMAEARAFDADGRLACSA